MWTQNPFDEKTFDVHTLDVQPVTNHSDLVL
jgi:hypothetical protein